MPKVVINTTFGGFSIPPLMCKQYGMDPYDHIERTDPRLVEFVEKHPTGCKDLGIADVPDDVKWHIEEYDGREWVAENHRIWHARD